MPLLEEFEKALNKAIKLHDKASDLLDQYSDALDKALAQRDEARRVAARCWRGMRNNWLVIQDVRRRLGALPNSKLTGETGLAAATMRSHEALERQNDIMRDALEWIADLDTSECEDDALLAKIRAKIALRRLNILERNGKDQP